MTSRVWSASRFRILLVIGVLSVAFVLPAPAPADDAVMFEYKFKEGSGRDYKIKFSQEIYYGNFSFSTFSDLEVTVACVGIAEDGDFNIEIKFNKVDASRMRGDRMQETNLGAQLTGQSVACTVNKNGEVDDIKAMGYIEAWQQIEREITSVIQGFFVYLPGEKIAKGADWEHADESDQADLHITSQSKYSFKEIKGEKGRQCAKVEVETEVGIGGVQATPGGDYEAEGEGEGETEFYFDFADGIIVRMTDKMEVKIDLTPIGGGDGQEVTRSHQIDVELL